MHVIAWLLIGLIAGGIASYIVPGRTPGGTIGAVVVGIIGGLVGGWVLDLLGVATNLSWLGSLVVAVLGAVIILYVMRGMNRTTRV